MNLKGPSLLAVALLGALLAARAGNYTNFSVAVYIPINVVQSFDNPQKLADDWDCIHRQLKVDKRHPDFKDKVKVVFCSCGSREQPANITSNHDALEQIGVKNTGYVSPNTAHEFLTWRRSLHEFAPLLFTDN